MDTDDKEDEFLSEHCLTMRRALAYCLAAVPRLEALDPTGAIGDADKDLARIRQQALQDFDNQIDCLDHLEDVTPEEFRQRYQRRNLPCKIRHMGDDSFAVAQSKMVRQQTIHRPWFRQVLGQYKVPVRRIPACSNAGVDEHGRATECTTAKMTLDEWIQVLESSQSDFYLKDWHLVAFLQEHQPRELPLYHVPAHFGVDLLDCLLRFGPSDYRFCYWGPAGSWTAWHSDVMNTFSWSFNLAGTKVWTFAPPLAGAPNLTVRQEAGECLFVPAGWKHRVDNATEALSINHNWITTANLDLVWDCLQQELVEVQKELRQWQIDDLAAEESMLRGCVGMDVTAFLFMILVGLVDAFDRVGTHNDAIDDIVALASMLRQLRDEPCLGVLERAAATLEQSDGVQVIKELIGTVMSKFGDWL